MPNALAIKTILGGGLPGRVRGVEDLRRRVEAGLPYAALDALVRRFGLTQDEIASALSVPPRTLARRKRAGRLAPDESDRLVRLAHLGAEAERLLGTRANAVGWLRDENVALGGQIPLRLVGTEIGARQVEQILGQIEFGSIS